MIPKTTIAIIWKETKQEEERGRKNLQGALRRKNDLRLGDENALRIYARQSESLKNEWSKSEEKTQRGLFIGKGMYHSTMKKRETQRTLN